MASAPPGYVVLGHMLFELCRATGRPPPSYDIKQEKGKYTVDVTVGNEGPVRGSTHVNCMEALEAKGKAIMAWIDRFLPDWEEIWDTCDKDSKNWPTSLYSYCESGQLDEVKAALRRGEDVNRIWQHGSCGNKGCNMDPICDFKATPLQGAIKMNHTDVISSLLEQPDINLNLTTFNDYTALNQACLMDRPNIVRQLLKVPGIDPNIPNWFGRTPLMEAYLHRHGDCVKELLEMDGVILPEDTRNAPDGKRFDPWFRKMLISAKVQREKKVRERNEERQRELEQVKDSNATGNEAEGDVPEADFEADTEIEKPEETGEIMSEAGEHQGQPLTPLLFGLVWAPSAKAMEDLSNFKSLNAFYLDDCTLSRDSQMEVVAAIESSTIQTKELLNVTPRAS